MAWVYVCVPMRATRDRSRQSSAVLRNPALFRQRRGVPVPDLSSTAKRIEPSVPSPRTQAMKGERALAEAEGRPYGALAELERRVLYPKRGEATVRQPGRAG